MIVDPNRRDPMRAMAIAAPGVVKKHVLPMPVPGPGEVRVRVEGCGVCASNLGPWQGLPWLDYPRPPAEGGHEGWGTVERVGEDVTAVEVGSRVTFLASHAWAEYAVAEARTLVALPASLRDKPVPGEAFGCAVNVFKRSRIHPGQRVAIVGIGFVGAALCRMASLAGAVVTAISRRPDSLALAERMGAVHAIKMDDHARIVAACERVTHSRGFEVVIECVGLQWPLDLAGEIVAERGTLVVAGYHQDGPRRVPMQQWNWRGIDVVNAHERDPMVVAAGVREAVALIDAGALEVQALVTHTYPLEELGRALDDTAGKPEGFVKGVVIP